MFMKPVLPLVLPFLLLCLCCHAGCGGEEAASVVPEGEGDPHQPGTGEPCAAALPCRSGLICSRTGFCASPGDPGTAAEGEHCSQDEDCQWLLACGLAGTCVPSAGGGPGEGCDAERPCRADLSCSSSGSCAAPGEPGTSGQGEGCSSGDDCSFGLRCSGGTCLAFSAWSGTSCPAPAQDAVAYFRVPRAQEPVEEFYRLPFPNDIRLQEGRIDLKGHPDPGGALPVATVGSLLSALSRDRPGGFSPLATVIFRFSKPLDGETIDTTGETPSLFIVELDPQGAVEPHARGVSWRQRSRPGPYLCGSWLVVRGGGGWPLKAGRQVAVVVTKAVRPRQSGSFRRDADFDAVMGGSRPSDPDLARAYDLYEPLRRYLDAGGMATREEVLAAALFTVADRTAAADLLRQAVEALDPPAPLDPWICSQDGGSPCAASLGEDPSWRCPDASAAFLEIHGVFMMPIFQRGTAPYLRDGQGDLPIHGPQPPRPERSEEVCFGLSVPGTVPMPEEGWPVLIFAHGTGGSFRSHIENGLAELMADLRDLGGEPLGQIAVLGYDAPMHGPRRNGEADPDGLFFNYRNPEAARGNGLQGIADLFAVERLVQGFDIEVEGERVRMDPDRIYFMGHSQGASSGVPFLAFSKHVQAAVLSGAGGNLIASLMDKTKPAAMLPLLQMLFGELTLDEFHPLLSLLQHYFDPVDPVHYGRLLFAKRREGYLRKHVYQVYGLDDHYSPPSTMLALARSMLVQLAYRPLRASRAWTR